MSTPAQRLLPWPPAWAYPVTSSTLELETEVYGRPVRVTFPSIVGRQPDHVWVLAVWHGTDSGTGRPEARPACRTCSERAGWPVGPLACVAGLVEQ